MAKSFAQVKGSTAEREINNLLQPVIDRVYLEAGIDLVLTPRLQRNTLQSHLGGSDLCGLDYLAIEIKRQETLHLNDWVKQCIGQAKPNQIPILIYRQSRQPWRIQMYCIVVTGGSSNLKVWAEISYNSFIQWFEAKLKAEISKCQL